MVEGGGLENRRAQAPGVRIPLPPSSRTASGRAPRAGRRGWWAGYAALRTTPPAGAALGREATGLIEAEKAPEPLQVRALALAAGGAQWVLITLDASLVCSPTAADISGRLAAAGWLATVVASTAPTAPVLSSYADQGRYRAMVVELAETAATLAAGRLAPATLSAVGAALELDSGGLGAGSRMPYLDAVMVAPGPRRPRLAVAVAALPRLVDKQTGELRRGVWSLAERVLGAHCGEPVAVLGLPAAVAQEADSARQRAGRFQPVSQRLAASLLTAVSGEQEAVRAELEVVAETCELATQPLPDRHLVRGEADQAEFGIEDGTVCQRVRATARWAWLERVYHACMSGRTGQVPVPLTRVRLGDLVLLGVGADLSETVAAALSETGEAALTLVVNGAGGRAGAVLSEPERATLRGGREVEPLTDLWPLAADAVRHLAAGSRQ